MIRIWESGLWVMNSANPLSLFTTQALEHIIAYGMPDVYGYKCLIVIETYEAWPMRMPAARGGTALIRR